MTNLRSKVAYLHGLAEGLDINDSSAEGRVLAAMIDVMSEFADTVDEVCDAQDELAEYVEEMDGDLNVIEEHVFDDNDDEIAFIPEETLTDVEDGVELFNCPSCGETLSAAAGEMDNAEFEVTCPVCGCSLETVD